MIRTVLCIATLLAGGTCQVPEASTLTTQEARYTLALAGWPTEHIDDGLSVAYCESKFEPDRVGDGGLALGLFQIHPLWLDWASDRFDISDIDRLDPVQNARLAWLIFSEYDRERWEPWPSGQWTCQPGWVSVPEEEQLWPTLSN